MKVRTAKTDMPESSDYNHEAYAHGCNSFKEGRFGEAKKYFREALKYWPEDYQAWWALGNCYDELHKPLRAENCYTKAISYCSGKDQAAIFFNLGNSVFDQDRFAESIASYNKVPSGSKYWKQAQRNILLANQKK